MCDVHVSVTDEITMVLKQHNSRAIMHLTKASNSIQQALLEAKNGLQMDTYKLSDKVINSPATRCVCCRARGFNDYPAAASANSKAVRFNTRVAHRIHGQRLELSDNEATSPGPNPKRPHNTRGFNDCPASASANSKSVCFSTPVAQRIHGQRLELSDDEATSPGLKRKRPHNVDDCTSVSKKSSSGASGGLFNFFKTNLMAIAQLYADLPANTPATVFGQCCTNLQKRKNYIIHASPRIIRISVLAMSQQLVGTRGLHHELMSIIMRRYTQSDQEANSECPYMKWRHNMEPDFATIVLADHEYVTNISIQNQLVGKEIPYDITSCQMFFLPVPLEDGWIALMWDMMERKLHVLHPLIRGDGPSEPMKDKLKLVAWKLHHALFDCLNEYYAGWPTQDGQWVTKYPVIAEENFSRDETSACVLHICRHYDGVKMKIPLTKGSGGKPAARLMLRH
ncbi:hypothetical protein VPH35_086611 [Triticum aestivum]